MNPRDRWEHAQRSDEPDPIPLEWYILFAAALVLVIVVAVVL